MPTLNILTNVPVDKVAASEIIKSFSGLVAASIGKPESYVMVSLRDGVSMCFGGTEEPCSFMELISIGALDPEKNKKISADLCEALETKLGIAKNRVYIKFFDVARPFFGYNGSTFG